MLYDTHMHTHHSGDSEAAVQDMIESAIRKGLDGICFTDHFDYDYPDEPDLFLLDFDSYYQEIMSLQEKYKGRFPILWGVEIGLQPQIVDVNRRTSSRYPFDFVIGSSHVVHGVDPYYPKYYEGSTKRIWNILNQSSRICTLTQTLTYMGTSITSSATVRTETRIILIRSTPISLTTFFAL